MQLARQGPRCPSEVWRGDHLEYQLARCRDLERDRSERLLGAPDPGIERQHATCDEAIETARRKQTCRGSKQVTRSWPSGAAHPFLSRQRNIFSQARTVMASGGHGA